jgi:hypothetical protein
MSVASMLFRDGPIAYVMDPLSGMMVVPNLRKKVLFEASKVLGCTALLCVSFPSFRKKHILEAYCDLGARNQLKEDAKPVKRTPLVVTGHDSDLEIYFIHADGTQQDTLMSLVLMQLEVHMLSYKVRW